LEIFQYNQLEPRALTAVNRPGFGHIAFSVNNVTAACDAVLTGGGHNVGQIVTLEIANGARVTWAYVTDPEGNIIELQSWNDQES
jgi:predicted enzyme related to lactoylglutathione lyase